MVIAVQDISVHVSLDGSVEPPKMTKITIFSVSLMLFSVIGHKYHGSESIYSVPPSISCFFSIKRVLKRGRRCF
jgi:hypothetical protein